ncbi:MAG: ligD [Bacteroidota bacterium]|nr:ligD [Bacteroidota bacterium]
MTKTLIAKTARPNDITVVVDKRELHLTNQNKIYFPKEKITKGDVINYYNKMFKYILPYIKDRPESLRRTPNGITDDGFFQKDASADRPPWVKTSLIWSESTKKDVNYIICNDKSTLFYLNN